MRFLHTADIHIKNESHLEILNLIIDTAIAENCDAILVAGDFFDRDTSIHSIEGKLPAVLERYPGRILISSGNHDAEILRQRKALSSNSTVLDSASGIARIELDGIEIIALPFREGKELKDYGDLQADPDRSVLMAHGAFYSNDFFYGHSDRKSYFPIFEEDLRDRYRYVALGHYHRLIRKQFGKSIVINPGSPRVTKSSDLGKRQVAIVDSADWSVSMRELAVTYYFPLTLNISVFDDSDSILDRLERLLAPVSGEEQKKLAILILKVSGTLSPQLTSALTLRHVLEDKLNRGKFEYHEIDMNNLHGIYTGLLDNQFVKRMLEESARLAESEGLSAEKAEQIAIERLNALFT